MAAVYSGTVTGDISTCELPPDASALRESCARRNCRRATSSGSRSRSGMKRFITQVFVRRYRPGGSTTIPRKRTVSIAFTSTQSCAAASRSSGGRYFAGDHTAPASKFRSVGRWRLGFSATAPLGRRCTNAPTDQRHRRMDRREGQATGTVANSFGSCFAWRARCGVEP